MRKLYLLDHRVHNEFADQKIREKSLSIEIEDMNATLYDMERTLFDMKCATQVKMSICSHTCINVYWHIYEFVASTIQFQQPNDQAQQLISSTAGRPLKRNQIHSASHKIMEGNKKHQQTYLSPYSPLFWLYLLLWLYTQSRIYLYAWRLWTAYNYQFMWAASDCCQN